MPSNIAPSVPRDADGLCPHGQRFYCGECPSPGPDDPVHKFYGEAAGGWLDKVRARLEDDSDAYADVDLLHGLYTALTGRDIPHPYEEDAPNDERRPAGYIPPQA